MSATFELRMSGTSSLKVKPSTVTRSGRVPLCRQQAQALARDRCADVVVDAPAGQDDLRVIAEALCAMRQVVGIDADAVPADQARREGEKIPFRRGGRQHVEGVDAELAENRGQLVHEGDVQIALRVLDHLRGLGDLDRRRPVDAGLEHRAVDGGDDVERRSVLSRHDLEDGLEAMRLVAWIDALGGVADGEVAPGNEARLALEHRNADVFRRAGKDRRLVDDDVALAQSVRPTVAEAPSSARKSGTAILVDRGRDGDDVEVALGKVLGLRRQAQALVASDRPG